MSWMPLRYLRIFWGYVGSRLLALVMMTLVMSYAEGFGIALFFPLFAPASDGSVDAVSRTFLRFFALVGVRPSPVAALPFIILVFVGKGVLAYAIAIYQERLTHDVTRGLRRKLVGALGRSTYGHASASAGGEQAHVVVGEVARAAAGFLHFTRSLSPVLSAGVLFAIVAVVDWRSTAVCVVMGVTLFAALRATGRRAVYHSARLATQSGALTSLVVQTFQSFRYLRATGSFGTLEKRIDLASEQALGSSLRSATAGMAMHAMGQPVMVVFLSGLIYYRVAVRGEPLAALFVVLIYFLRIMTELVMLQTSWQTFCGLAGSVDLVRAHTDAAARESEQGGTVPYAGVHDAIACRDVTFGYASDRPVLRGVTLTVPRFHTVAFVGASGSGKSTLVDLVIGTLKPDAGVVTIDGRSLRELDLETLRARVGYVPQEAALFDDTVLQNITLWKPETARDQVVAAAQQAHAAELIDAMPRGYDQPVGERGGLLSGGQRQRLVIARELLKVPDILVLDEATSALDSASERAIKSSIDSLKGKMTILVVAHRLSTVRSADRIYVLAEGRIVEEGSYEELLAMGGQFREMVEQQSLGGAQ